MKRRSHTVSIPNAWSLFYTLHLLCSRVQSFQKNPEQVKLFWMFKQTATVNIQEIKFVILNWDSEPSFREKHQCLQTCRKKRILLEITNMCHSMTVVQKVWLAILIPVLMFSSMPLEFQGGSHAYNLQHFTFMKSGDFLKSGWLLFGTTCTRWPLHLVMYVNKPHYLTGSELTYAEKKKKKSRKTKPEVEKEKYVDKEMSEQTWKENLIKDGHFLKNYYFGNVTNFDFFLNFILNLCKYPGM